MQVSIYVSESDYETFSGNRPTEFRTTAMFLADVLRKAAADIRKNADGAPIASKKDIIIGS